MMKEFENRLITFTQARSHPWIQKLSIRFKVDLRRAPEGIRNSTYQEEKIGFDPMKVAVPDPVVGGLAGENEPS